MVMPDARSTTILKFVGHDTTAKRQQGCHGLSTCGKLYMGQYSVEYSVRNDSWSTRPLHTSGVLKRVTSRSAARIVALERYKFRLKITMNVVKRF